MTSAPLSFDGRLRRLDTKVTGPFSRQVIEGARHARAGDGNPLRLTFFATAMRILCSRKNLSVILREMPSDHGPYGDPIVKTAFAGCQYMFGTAT